MCRGEYAWKTGRIHTSLWKTNHLRLLTILDGGDTRSPTRRGKDADGPLRPLPGAPQKGCLEPRSSLLGASTGLCHETSVLLFGGLSHPAPQVGSAEAFLARWLGAGHLLRLVEEEPA